VALLLVATALLLKLSSRAIVGTFKALAGSAAEPQGRGIRSTHLACRPRPPRPCSAEERAQLSLSAPGFVGLHPAHRPRRLLSQSVLLLAARRRGWRLDEAAAAGGPSARSLMALSRRGDRRFFHYYATPLTSYIGSKVMDSKAISQSLMRAGGIRVPRFVELRLSTRLETTLSRIAAERLAFPVVLKPSLGSHGDGVALDLADASALRHALVAARRARASKETKAGDAWLVEEQHEGRHWRVLVLGGVVADVVERLPARVTGDGASTIEQLVAADDAARKAAGLSPHAPDWRWVGRRLGNSVDAPRRFVPSAGETVVVNPRAATATGGTTRHAPRTEWEGARALADAVRAVLSILPGDARIVGLDAIGELANEGGLVVHELNAHPDTSVHFSAVGRPPASDCPFSVAERVLDSLCM
jgi:cyanophycin synthetase